MTRLEQLRLDRLLSREQLSEATGVPVRTIRALERESIRRPRISTLAPLAEYFNVPASSLVEPELEQPNGAAA